ncbi:hypothetical protein [Comamonas sp. JC664]|uniref:hypothetical protein n=1 Tax=Comamonas sp. JC664 TaxID=2801917 RepID=UPI0036191C65
MAHALGGRVDYHPQGREMGCLDIALLPGAEHEALLAGSGRHFKANLTHMQTVLELPPGAGCWPARPMIRTRSCAMGPMRCPPSSIRSSARLWLPPASSCARRCCKLKVLTRRRCSRS